MSLRLPTPTEFPAFPFKPYDIQSDLMRQVYDSIEDHKVAIMESPTGTVRVFIYDPLDGSLTMHRVKH